MAKSIEDIPVSTQTIIASSNCTFDIFQLFKVYPIDAMTIQPVSVEIMYYQNEYRGRVYADFHPKKKRNFRNAINVISYIEKDEKRINFKLSKNGKFQLTGCRHEDQAMAVVTNFIETVYRYCPSCIVCPTNTLQVYFQTVMTNIDFSLGFSVDRQRLDYLMNKRTPFHSLLETSFGYTGVNIKLPVEIPWWTIPVPLLTCTTSILDGGQGTLERPRNQWVKQYRPLCDIAPAANFAQRPKYNTFLVFHSGSVIMSGMNKTTMHVHYDLFNEMLRLWKDSIQEQLIET